MRPARTEPASILHALRVAAERYPERPAVSCRGRTLAYRELARAVLALGARLQSRGAAGQCVLVALPTSIEAVVAVLGAFAAGARAAPLNPFLTGSELSGLLPEIDARLAIVGADAEQKLAALSGH